MSEINSPFFRLSNDLLFRCTLDGRFLAANPAWKTQLGIDPETLTGRELESLLSEESAPAARRFLAREGDADAPLPLTFLDSRGQRRDFVLKGEFRDESGEFFGVAARVVPEAVSEGEFGTDEPPGQRAEDVRWKLAIEGVQGGLWDLNYETGESYCSERWCKMLGYDRSEIPASREEWYRIVHPDDAARLKRRVEAYFEGRSPEFCMDVRFRTKSGLYRWVQTQGACFRDETGRVLRFTGWHIDIHAQKTAEARLQSFALNGPAVVFQWAERKDGTSGFNWLSAKVREMFGVEPFESDLFQSRIHPDDLDAFRRAMSATSSAETRFEFEGRYIWPDGSVKWWRAQADIVSVDRHEVIFNGFILDITEKMIARQRIDESGRRFRDLAENMPGVVFQLVSQPDGSKSFTYVSPKARDVFERPSEWLSQHPDRWHEVVHPQDLTAYRNAIRDGEESISHFEWSGRIVTPCGLVKWVRLHATPTSEPNGQVLWNGLLIDITKEREQREEQLRLLKLIDASTDYISIMRLDGTAVYLNRPYRELCGLTHDEPLDGSMRCEVHPPWVRSRLLDVGIPTAIEKGAWTFESALVTREGTEIPCSQLIVALRSESGAVDHIGTVTRDIGAIKDQERLMMEQQAQIMAASKLAALGEMAGGIAHEINNPLAIIHAYAERLSDFAASGSVEPALISRTAKKIEETSHRIGRIVSGLRLIARDDRQDGFERARVSTLLGDTLGVCTEKFRYLGIGLDIEQSCAAEIEIECRPVQICQVFLNLLLNAQQAVETCAEKWIRVRVSDLESHVEIRVEDSGPGIPQGLRERIFNPFFTTKSIGQGTGLGLSISESIVKSHCGQIFVDPANANTCFIVVLPKKQSILETPVVSRSVA